MQFAGDVVIGLDVGTTGTKAVAFAIGSPQRYVAYREYPLLHPAPLQKVQDPEVVRQAVVSALTECVRELGGATVRAISVSAAMHGLMALDATGEPITPLVTWADGRAGDEVTELIRTGCAEELQGLTGTPVHPMTPFAKLLWFARHDTDTWDNARYWVGLKDFLLRMLTGSLVTEVSSASGTGLLELSSGTWSSRALEICKLDESRLPEVLPTTATLRLAPTIAAEIGLPRDTPVAVGAADGPLGNLGTRAIEPGVAGLSLGTSGALRVTVNEVCADPRGSLFCYALAEPLWIVGGATSNGADVLRWAGRTFSPGSEVPANVDEAALRLASGVNAGSDGLVMLPFLLPERSPLWDSELAGAFLGLRQEHTWAHLVRAGIEGVCLQMRLILDRVDANYPVSCVRATGGAFRARLWSELMAAALDRPFYVVGEAEGTALGAAVLGLVAIGAAATFDDAFALAGTSGVENVSPVEVSPDLVEMFADMRSRVPRLLDSLARVASAESLE